ncbi:SusD family protein [Chitinophaga ginsengisegetis]|uniref:SusD family protein n=1 Tax=Chitinophaga ginsengisegetis TaxID=393003 RepID=A0A1T5NBR1_9BACT|nr:RagB/SusD family nutrient uptake outer membrane protein [Chitinophaga ginsengisegetis]SKC97794.1 SusD family protein [Chitinophaga ginsengisegetis]
MRIPNRRYILLFLTAVIVVTVSCKKGYLEVEPKGALIAKATQDYEALLNTTKVDPSTAAGFLGDEVAAQQSYFGGASVYRQRLFKYIGDALLPDDLPEMGYLKSNYAFNKIIEEIDASTGGTEQQKAQIMAEAKVGRAVCHLLFLNDFGKPYNEATAATDWGVPIITAADVTKTDYKRATVKEVYEFIINDITEALPNLSKPFSHSLKISKPAAEGILARVYLYMHNYTASREHLDKAFSALTGATKPVGLYDYNVTLSPDGTWQPADPAYFGPALMPNSFLGEDQESILNMSLSTFYIGSANAFVCRPEVAALYDPSDFRLQIYSNTELFGTVIFPNGMRRYPRFSAEVGICLPDMYLMRAELKARANDLAGAKADVELLRANRMPAAAAAVPAGIAANQQQLVRFILEERIREFALKGMRWYDVRRLSTDPVYSNTINYTHKLYSVTGDVVESYTLTPERLVLKFGRKLTSQHPLLIENP